LDSLKIALTQSSGTNRVDILNQLSKELKHVEPEQALEYAEEAFGLANSISFNEGEAAANINSGNVYRKLGKFNKAIEAYNIALQISQGAHYGNGIARAFNGLGIAYNLLGDYDKSLESFLNSLKTYEQNEDLSGTADALNNVGIHYLFLGDPDNALDYYIRALDIRREIGDIEDIAASLNNIGDVYSDLGESDSALNYFLEALQLQESKGNNDLIFALQMNIGILYIDLNDQNKALLHYQKGLAIAEKLGDDWGMAMSYNYLGMAYLKSGDFKKAESFFKQSLDLAQKIESKAVIKEVYKNLSELSMARKDHKRSLEYYKLYTEVKDSILNENTNKQMAEMRTRFETEQKEAEINELTIERTIQELKLNKSENLKWFFIIASILILLLTVFVFYGLRQKQKANELLVERNKLEIENKNRAISLFGQQVSKEVALELLSNSLKASSNKLYACIMFLDIRGFTPFVEDKEPVEIIQYQNDVFGFMIEIVSKYHGIINQFLGDGFMATFGAPASTGNDCQNAVNASIDIMELLNEKCEAGEIPETKVGIGLHAGYIVTGNVGTSERKQYSITGNTVILASRIEQLNKKFRSTILLSKEVLEHLDQTKLKIENLGLEYLKGRAEPMEIIRIK
jgi:class 3 adenylate cyclase/Tfp pilus assembly protein PilF